MKITRLIVESAIALIIGFGLGLTYAWVISPVKYVDADPQALRADFKDHFRSAISAAYASTGDLERARARLALFNDPDPAQALNQDGADDEQDGEHHDQRDQPQHDKANALHQIAVHQRRPPRRRFLKIVRAAARLMARVTTKRITPMPKSAW